MSDETEFDKMRRHFDRIDANRKAKVRNAILEEAAQAISHFSCTCSHIVRSLKSGETP